MTRIAVNGVHLNVEVSGSGRPLVLLHGFTGSASTWAPLARALSPDRRVIAVDLLGHGRSDDPPDPVRYRVERQVEDLEAVLRRLDVDEYDLLGYSMGGRLALHLALANRARIGSLVLESAAPGIEGRADREERVRQDEGLADLLDRQGLESFVDRWEALPLFASQSRLPEERRAELRQQRLSGSPAGLAASLRGFGAGVPEPLFERLDRLPRALLIAGELDEKYCALARVMANRIPHSTVAIVPGAGHAVHLERPEFFEKLVRKFLGEPARRVIHGDVNPGRYAATSAAITRKGDS